MLLMAVVALHRFDGSRGRMKIILHFQSSWNLGLVFDCENCPSPMPPIELLVWENGTTLAIDRVAEQCDSNDWAIAWLPKDWASYFHFSKYVHEPNLQVPYAQYNMSWHNPAWDIEGTFEYAVTKDNVPVQLLYSLPRQQGEPEHSGVSVDAKVMVYNPHEYLPDEAYQIPSFCGQHLPPVGQPFIVWFRSFWDLFGLPQFKFVW